MKKPLREGAFSFSGAGCNWLDFTPPRWPEFTPALTHKHSGAAGGQYSGDTAFVANDSALNERSLFRTDNWGLGNLTPADVNGAGFGVTFSLAPSSALQTTDRYIDSVATRILYTALA